MEKEFELNPDLKDEMLNFYIATLILSKKDGYKGVVEKELDNKYNDKTDLKSTDLMMLWSLYTQISNNEKAEKYKKILIEKEPKGMFAQQERSKKIMEEEDDDLKIALFEEFERDFSKSMMLSTSAISVASIYIKKGDKAKLKELIVKLPKQNARFYNLLATQVLDKNLDYTIAEELSLKSLEILSTENIKGNSTGRESVLIFRDTYARILEKQGRLEEALENHKKALGNKPEDYSVKVNESYVLLAVKLGKIEEAKEAGENFMRMGKSTPKIREAIKNIYIKTNTQKGVEEYLLTLEKDAKIKKHDELINAMLSELAPAFSLKDLNGKIVSLTDFRGKVVIIDFWATWCGPCIKSFPAMQKAQLKYKNNASVQFLFIDTWEQTEDFLPKVREFINAKKYNDFLVLIDDKSKVIESYKVKGIPTKFIIDAEGIIRFKSTGFDGNEDEVIEEISKMIDVTLLTKNK